MQITLILFVIFGIICLVPLVFSAISYIRRKEDGPLFVFLLVVFALIVAGIAATGRCWNRPVEICIIDVDGNRIVQKLERHQFDDTDKCVIVTDEGRWTKYCGYKKFVYRYLDK